MSKRLAIILIAASALAVGPLSISQASVKPQLELRDPTQPALPVPGNPTASTATTAATCMFQLVGFTRETLDGSRGVLNHTLTCQKEFPYSRVCTAEEVRRTVNVPAAPGNGQAWAEISPSHCTAMDLNSSYGALFSSNCDQSLRVACCAMIPEIERGDRSVGR